MKVISMYHLAGRFLSVLPIWLRYGLVLPVTIGLSFSTLSAQKIFEQTAPSKYRIEFINKNDNPFTLDNPGEFLSQKALERRNKQNIPVTPDDLPVTPAYIDSLRATGAEILTVSRWFNAVTVKVTHDSILSKISRLNFVKGFNQGKSFPGNTKMDAGSRGIQMLNEAPVEDYGPSWWQTAIHNGQLLHNRGYRGQGVTIAVIDAGFYHVDQLAVFNKLWENNQILGTRDFVNPGAGLFEGHTHGMHVLSIIGGNLPGELIGTATDADFWLLRSEDTGSEYLVEEDNWVAAAEFADSAGADIISSSLGYTVFDDSLQNHSYNDMDGNTARASRAADLAASKGMLVVVSAGNQGNSSWKYIGVPADADSVLAIGAIDQNRSVAYFSSRGPSSDGDVKPDVMAIGLGTYMAGYEGGIRQGNGTSLSAPIIAGLSACLWQANPHASAMDVLSAIRESADRYSLPDDDYGYGIPDFNLASVLLHLNEDDPGFTEEITAFPNPFHDQLYILFKPSVDVPVELCLYDLAGKEIARYIYPQFPGRNYLKIEGDMLNSLPRGLYILKVNASQVNGISKLIKF
jgi:serine protease AprX